jgi:spermidine synthase
MVGLGGGSLAKFCYREFTRCRIDVAEIDGNVVAMRREFFVPNDGARFAVHVEDGAEFVARHENTFDVLLLDAYDSEGIPAQLSTARYYRQCRRALRAGGVLVSNVYRTTGRTHVERIKAAFGSMRVLVDEALKPNRVVFAYAGDLRAVREGTTRFDAKRLRPESWAQIRDDVWRVAKLLAARL